MPVKKVTVKKKAARGTTLASRTRPSRPQTEAERVREYNMNTDEYKANSANTQPDARLERARARAATATRLGLTGVERLRYITGKQNSRDMAKGGTVKKAARGATVKPKPRVLPSSSGSGSSGSGGSRSSTTRPMAKGGTVRRKK